MSPRVLGRRNQWLAVMLVKVLTNDNITPAGNVAQNAAVVLNIGGAGEPREKHYHRKLSLRTEIQLSICEFICILYSPTWVCRLLDNDPAPLSTLG